MNSCNAQLSIFSKPQYRSERSYRLRRPFCYEVGSGAVRWLNRESPTPFYNRAILDFPETSAVSWPLEKMFAIWLLGRVRRERVVK
jgi:hypothetical protein